MSSPPLGEDLAPRSMMGPTRLPQFVTRREKFLPPDQETIIDSQVDSFESASTQVTTLLTRLHGLPFYFIVVYQTHQYDTQKADLQI